MPWLSQNAGNAQSLILCLSNYQNIPHVLPVDRHIGRTAITQSDQIHI